MKTPPGVQDSQARVTYERKFFLESHTPENLAETYLTVAGCVRIFGNFSLDDFRRLILTFSPEDLRQRIGSEEIPALDLNSPKPESLEMQDDTHVKLTLILLIVCRKISSGENGIYYALNAHLQAILTQQGYWPKSPPLPPRRSDPSLPKRTGCSAALTACFSRIFKAIGGRSDSPQLAVLTPPPSPMDLLPPAQTQ